MNELTELEMFLIEIWPYTRKETLDGTDKVFNAVMTKLLGDGRFRDWLDLNFLLTLCWIREYHLDD